VFALWPVGLLTSRFEQPLRATATRPPPNAVRLPTGRAHG